MNANVTAIFSADFMIFSPSLKLCQFFFHLQFYLFVVLVSCSFNFPDRSCMCSLQVKEGESSPLISDSLITAENGGSAAGDEPLNVPMWSSKYSGVKMALLSVHGTIPNSA
jgi:hypothetical protein